VFWVEASCVRHFFLVNSMYIEMENANSFHIRNCMDSEGLN
jgi:hypothetical protein